MSVYKEENYELQELCNQQYQIYDYACDHGIAVKPHDPMWVAIASLIRRITNMNFNMHREVIHYNVGRTTRVVFYLPWEYSTPGKSDDGMTCSKWTVEYIETFNPGKWDKNYIELGSQRVTHISDKDVYVE